MRDESPAVYTTAYPAALPWLPAWARSLAAQTDRDFTLWMGLDGLTPDAVRATCPLPADTRYVVARPGETPGALRFRVLAEIAEAHESVVLVDADDILLPGRVARARAGLADADVHACALRLVDADGAPSGRSFGPADPAVAADALPHWNVFGLSNTAWRAACVRACLPGPADCELVDWYLATLAWLDGATLAFDPVPQMDYRRHGANLAPVEPPFSEGELRRATGRVLAHHQFVAAARPGLPGPRAAALVSARQAVSRFHGQVLGDPSRLAGYLDAVNRLPAERVWWWAVANPQLEAWWTN